MATEFRECFNTDTSQWPRGDVEACPEKISYTMNSVVSYYSTKICWIPACMRLVALMKTDNPVECVTADFRDTRYPYVRLYTDILTPLEKACSQLNSPRTVDPVSSPSAEATMTPTSPAPTTQPPTSATRTKAPSTSRPDSPGSTDSTGSESTLTPSDTTSSPTSPSPEATPLPLQSSSNSPSFSSSSSSPSSLSSAASSSSSSSSDRDQSVLDDATTTQSPDGIVRDADAATSSTSSSPGLVAGIIVGTVLLLVVLFIIFKRKSRRNAKSSAAKLDLSMTNTTTDTSMFTREDMEIFDRQLMALDNWRVDSSEIVDGRLLGCGAQGAVYLVIFDGRRRLASKRLVRDQLTKQHLESVIRAIELASKLQHPSIVEFVGVAWTTPSDFQALFEYMANGDLRTHLDCTKPPQPQPQPQPWSGEKLKHAVQIAQALVYVHSFNPPVVHRDIKARNILLDEDMNAKLSDFVVSRSLSEQATMTTGIGTSRWLAPEVIMGGGKYTEQCDIYSFGVLLVEMDSHALPYVGEKLSEIDLAASCGHGNLASYVVRSV